MASAGRGWDHFGVQLPGGRLGVECLPCGDLRQCICMEAIAEDTADCTSSAARLQSRHGDEWVATGLFMNQLGQWDGLFATDATIDLNAVFPRPATTGRVAYATSYVVNTYERRT